MPIRTVAWQRIVPQLLLVCGLMLVLGIAAYLVPFSTLLDVGGQPGSRLYDEPYLQPLRFNKDPELDAAKLHAFRWTFGDAAIRWPGTGQQAALLTMSVLGRIDAAASRWQTNQEALLDVPIQPQPRQYHLLIPAGSDDLALQMQTPTFRPQGDERDLAFALDWVRVRSIGPGRPAWSQIGWCVLAAGLLYGLFHVWRLPSRLPLLLAAASAIGLAGLLAWQRLVLTTTTPRLVALLALALPLTLVAQRGLRGLALRFQPLASRQSQVIAALLVLAWLVRTVALLHPQTRNSDIGLNSNNLRSMLQGEVFISEGLTAEAGGGEAPYPPASYLVLAPFAALVDRELLTTVAAALVDSVVIGGLWLLCSMVSLPAAVGIFASVLYLFATPSLHSLSVGEMANVWGQALTLPLLVALVGHQRKVVSTAAVIGWGAVALLGHLGVFLSLLAFFACYSLVMVALRVPRTLPALLALILATLGAGAAYYSAWTAFFLERPPAPPPTGSITTQLLGPITGEFLPDAFIGPLLMILGLLGMGLLWHSGSALRGPALAWWLAGLASLATLLFSQQALRWQLWLFPVVALCGGVALAWFWQRGRAGQGVAMTLLAACVLRGGYLWVQQVVRY